MMGDGDGRCGWCRWWVALVGNDGGVVLEVVMKAVVMVVDG